MSVKQKKKLCWNCEGRVPLTEENCPFCGVYITPLDLSENPLLKPPYRIVDEEEEEEQEIPSSPFADKEGNPHSEEEAKAVAMEAPLSSDMNRVAITALLLLAGTVFLMFGTTLWFYSDIGVLVLQWDAQYWFVYLLVALPLLFFGWRSLMKISDEKPTNQVSASCCSPFVRMSATSLCAPQHFLYFFPLPQGQRSFLPVFGPTCMGERDSFSGG